MVTRKFLHHILLSAGTILGLTNGSNAVPGATVDSKILILARDEYSASTAKSGLQGYGIPFESILVPKEGIQLPVLTSGATQGKYGGVIVLGSVSYDYSGTWKSALTQAQWDAINKYQTDFHVRLARIDEYPGPAFGKLPLPLDTVQF